MSTETPRTKAIFDLLSITWHPETDYEHFVAAKEGARCGVEDLERRNSELTASLSKKQDDLDVQFGQLQESRRHVSELTARIAELEKKAREFPWEIVGKHKRLTEQLAEARKDSAWQPIETAPKDGTPILACLPPFIPALVQWLRGKWSIDPEGFAAQEHFEEVFSSTEYHPTHWMPLPATPLPETKGTI